jgi:hypothetical protein
MYNIVSSYNLRSSSLKPLTLLNLYWVSPVCFLAEQQICILFIENLKHIFICSNLIPNEISAETGCLDSIPRLLVIKSNDIFE